jgi:hypothetical protein
MKTDGRLGYPSKISLLKNLAGDVPEVGDDVICVRRTVAWQSLNFQRAERTIAVIKQLMLLSLCYPIEGGGVKPKKRPTPDAAREGQSEQQGKQANEKPAVSSRFSVCSSQEKSDGLPSLEMG